MTKGLSFEQLFEYIKKAYNLENGEKSIYDIVEDPSRYGLVALEYDNYYSTIFISSSRMLIEQTINLLKEEKFIILGNVDSYGSQALYYKLKDVEALKDDPMLKQLKDSIPTNKKLYGYDKESNSYFFYFIPYNAKYDTWFRFRNEMVDKIANIARNNNSYATMQFVQKDNLVANKCVFNITIKGDNGNPEYIYYFDNLHVLVDATFDDFRKTFISLSLLLKIASNEDDFNLVSNGIELINEDNNQEQEP